MLKFGHYSTKLEQLLRRGDVEIRAISLVSLISTNLEQLLRRGDVEIFVVSDGLSVFRRPPDVPRPQRRIGFEVASHLMIALRVRRVAHFVARQIRSERHVQRDGRHHGSVPGGWEEGS